MEDQINALKCLRRNTLRNSLKIKENVISQTNELVNLLIERQHELCFYIDECYHQQIWLCDDILHKYLLSASSFPSPGSEDDFQRLKDLHTKEMNSLSRDMLICEKKIEELKLAINNFGEFLRSSMIAKRGAHEDPKLDHGISRNKQMRNLPEQCSLASNCSGGSKGFSDDSFVVMETTELCEEDMPTCRKHENLSRKKALFPDDMKFSLKVSEWLHKNDNVHKECVTVPSSSGVKIPLQMVKKSEPVSHAVVPIDEERFGNFVSSVNQIQNQSDPYFLATEIDPPEYFVTRDDLKIWLNEKYTKGVTKNSPHIPDSTTSLKVSEWLLKNDNMDKECMIVTSSSGVEMPLQTVKKSEPVSHAVVPMDEEHFGNFVSSVNQTQNQSDPYLHATEIDPYFFATESEYFAARDHLKIWLSDASKDRGDEPISTQPINVSNKQSNAVQPSLARDDFKKWISIDSKELDKSTDTHLSPAKIVEQSFSSYLVKDNHKEWLCSGICI